jgi:alpha-tubulin suppressor-like RCC1 family protein
MGYNNNGQIGNGTKTDVLTPTQILPGGVAGIAGGLAHTVVLKTDHSIWAVGYDNNGELGNGNTTGVLSLVQIRRPSLAKGDQ